MATIGATSYHGTTYLAARSFGFATDLADAVSDRTLRLRRLSPRFLGRAAWIFIRI